MAVLWSDSWAYANGTSPSSITPGLSGAGSSALIQSNLLRLITGSAVSGPGKVSRRANIAVTSNMEVTGSVVLTTTSTSYTWGAQVRDTSALDGAYGYGLNIQNNGGTITWQLVKSVNYTYTELLANAAHGLSASNGSTVFYRLRAVGALIQAKVWTGTEPGTWDYSATDPTPYLTAGYAGWSLYSYNDTGRSMDMGPVTLTDGAVPSGVTGTGRITLVGGTTATRSPIAGTASLSLGTTGAGAPGTPPAAGVLWSETWPYANGTAPATIAPGFSPSGSYAQVFSNKLRLQSGTAAGPSSKVSRHIVLTPVTDYEILVPITLVTTTGDYTGDILARTESAVDGQYGYSVGYRMNLDAGTFSWYVVKAVDYTFTTLYTSSTVAGVTAGSTIWVRLRVIGSQIQARVWKSTDPEPTGWPCNFTDGSPYNTAGYVGMDLFATNGSQSRVELGPMTVSSGVVGNVAPTANAGSDQSSVAPFTTVNLTGIGSDSDGTVSTYTWSQTSGPIVPLAGSGPNRSFPAPAVLGGATLTFQLIVTDNAGAVSAPDTMTVGVTRATLLRNNGSGWYGVRKIRNLGGGGLTGSASLYITGTGSTATRTTGARSLTLTASGAATAPSTGLTGLGAVVLSAAGTATVRATGTRSLSLSANGTAAGPASALTRLPMQPAGIYYGNLTGPTNTQYRQPGALVITSRGNFGHANMVAAAAAGAHVIGYFDALVWAVFGTDDVTGRLLNSSIYGPAVPKWPGPVNANGTGDLADFRPGSVMHQPSYTNSSWTKLEAVLESIVAENPHLGGFFADDLGSRSWYPNFDWGTFGTTNQQNYRDGAILILQAFRRVCTRHGMFLLVNGTWASGTLSGNGGGYPTMGTHGCSLADGGVWEHHGAPDSYSNGYFGQTGTQWGSGSPLTGTNKAFHLVIGNVGESVAQWQSTGNYAWFNQQTDYTATPPTPWGSFHATGLPTHTS